MSQGSSPPTLNVMQKQSGENFNRRKQGHWFSPCNSEGTDSHLQSLGSSGELLMVCRWCAGGLLSTAPQRDLLEACKKLQALCRSYPTLSNFKEFSILKIWLKTVFQETVPSPPRDTAAPFHPFNSDRRGFSPKVTHDVLPRVTEMRF